MINTVDLFKKIATHFQQSVDGCSKAEEMFDEVEKVFLDNLLVRDLSLITNAIGLIEKSVGDIQIAQLADQLNISERTIRTHFNNHVGCAPKEYIRLVKLRQAAYQMKHSGNSLTDIAYDNNYFDQAHFIHEVKNITGKSPNELGKEIPHFRFLQF